MNLNPVIMFQKLGKAEIFEKNNRWRIMLPLSLITAFTIIGILLLGVLSFLFYVAQDIQVFHRLMNP